MRLVPTSSARDFLRRFSRKRVLKRRFSSEFGRQRLYVTPHASLRYWKPGLDHVDRESFQFIRRFVSSGDVIWDIGANVGTFAFAAAWKAGPSGQVLAVEPDAWLHSLLLKSANQQTAGAAAVQPLCFALGSEPGVQPFCISRLSRSTGHLEQVADLQSLALTGGVEQAIAVPVITLDILREKHTAPTVVKIDVEGAEALVLQGAAELLATARPVIYCEVKTANQKAVTEILRSFDYQIAGLLPDGELRFYSHAPGNTVALPETP